MTIIISGGSIDIDFAARYIDSIKDKAAVTYIAADKGVDACEKLGITPSFIIGDFDSLMDAEPEDDSMATSKTLVKQPEADKAIHLTEQGQPSAANDGQHSAYQHSAYQELLKEYSTSKIIKLSPLKDDTDTEAAIRLALDETKGDIVLLGATGTRLDHVLGNIALLGLSFESGREISIIDPNNRIRLIRDELYLYKRDSIYKYVSFLPYMGPAKGVTMEGFKYEVKDATLVGFSTLGISNELREDVARVTVNEGMLVCIESLD